jgi:hypothetical protein
LNRQKRLPSYNIASGQRSSIIWRHMASTGALIGVALDPSGAVVSGVKPDGTSRISSSPARGHLNSPGADFRIVGNSEIMVRPGLLA